MPKKIAYILIAVLVLIIASGCTKRQCVEADYATFQPILDYPADGATVKYPQPITFKWHHNEPCEPSRYKVNLYDSEENKLGSDQVLDGSSEATIHLLQFKPTLVLEPGREFQWSVIPIGEKGESIEGQESEIFTFFYGEKCTPGDLIPPVLIAPEDESWATKAANPPQITLKWSHLDECYPDGYHYQVATDPDFEHIVVSEKFNDPRTRVELYVPQCTHLYWRVQSWVGNSKSDFSEVYDFYYANDNTCWLHQSPEDMNLIKGYVFQDECEHTGQINIGGGEVLPPCISSEYGVHGDGVWDSNINNEIGLHKVLVELGSGPCPSTGLDEFVSMSNGLYYFTPPKASGEYCVSISKSNDPGQVYKFWVLNPDLEDGIFTLPLTDQVITDQAVIFKQNAGEVNLNFGWDKNDFKKMNYTTEMLTTCRQTDNKNSAALMYLEEGSVIPVVATNEAKTWFLTAFNCFVSTATGEAEEGDLPLYPEQPIPVIDDETDSGKNDPGVKPCSSYTAPRSCVYPRCTWVSPIAGPSYCTESD